MDLILIGVIVVTFIGAKINFAGGGVSGYLPEPEANYGGQRRICDAGIPPAFQAIHRVRHL